MIVKYSISNYFHFFFKIYITGILFFSTFRVLLFISQLSKIDSSESISIVIKSFFMGIRFDTVISGYILILPYLCILTLSFFKKVSKPISSILFGYIFLFYSIAFLVCAIDIPYFNFFYSRLSIVALQWMETPVTVFKMAFQEPKIWIISLPFLLIIFLFYKQLKQQFKKFDFESQKVKTSNIMFTIVGLLFIFIGIRGSLEPKATIHISTAYFSDNSFLNQLGLNPNFTLIRSYIESKKKDNIFINLMDDSLAVENVRNYLNIRSNDQSNPFLKNIKSNLNLPVNKCNVVLIMMESMSYDKMGINGNKNNLTPFLDSLATNGYYFENVYSSGIHTYNGVYSTLTSYPALFMQHPMRDGKIANYNSIFSSLRQNGYATSYFTTHDGFYDNVEGFMKANDCQNVISEANYPTKELKTAFGVPDDYMFRFSIPVLNDMHKKNKPFFVAMMTTSDHAPYYIPSYFKPTANDVAMQATQYADYSLQKFMQLASKQDWYSNTLFVFVADHGMPMDQNYDMPLSYNHIPLIFYSPKLIKVSKKFDKIAAQIDVYPTIMGLLNLPYQNNSLGINLLTDNRPYAFFNGDDKYGVIDKDWFLMVRQDKSTYLYDYKNNDKKDFATKNKEVVTKMNEYAKSNLQAYQYYLKNKNKFAQ